MSFFDQHDVGCKPTSPCKRCTFFKLIAGVPGYTDILRDVDIFVEQAYQRGHADGYQEGFTSARQRESQSDIPPTTCLDSPTENRWSELQLKGLAASIDVLVLDARAANALKFYDAEGNYSPDVGARTLRDVVQRKRGELLRRPNFGRKSIEQIESELSRYDLRLEINPEDLPPAP